jgi:esterase
MSDLDQFHHYFMGNPESPKLVFLHGLLGFSANWRSVARRFESDYRVFVFDQRGHGRSIQPEQGYAPENYADDLLKLLDELKWEKINLVGHSMGGRNALNFASRFPDRVEKLVIEDIGPIGNPMAADGYRQMFKVIPIPFPSREAALAFMSYEFPKVWPQGGSQLGLFLYSNMVVRLDGQVEWKNSLTHVIDSVLEGHAQDRWSEWDSLRMPTLVIRGQLSRDLLAPIYDQMLQRNPRARGIVIEGAGHWVHFEKLDAFVNALREFLDKGPA